MNSLTVRYQSLRLLLLLDPVAYLIGTTLSEVRKNLDCACLRTDKGPLPLFIGLQFWDLFSNLNELYMFGDYDPFVCHNSQTQYTQYVILHTIVYWEKKRENIMEKFCIQYMENEIFQEFYV